MGDAGELKSMARSIIATVQQTIEVNDVVDVISTEIVSDDDGYVRELRIMGTAEGDANAPLTLVVRLKSPIKSNLDLTTPELDY